MSDKCNFILYLMCTTRDKVETCDGWTLKDMYDFLVKHEPIYTPNDPTNIKIGE